MRAMVRWSIVGGQLSKPSFSAKTSEWDLIFSTNFRNTRKLMSQPGPEKSAAKVAGSFRRRASILTPLRPNSGIRISPQPKLLPCPESPYRFRNIPEYPVPFEVHYISESGPPNPTGSKYRNTKQRGPREVSSRIVSSPNIVTTVSIFSTSLLLTAWRPPSTYSGA